MGTGSSKTANTNNQRGTGQPGDNRPKSPNFASPSDHLKQKAEEFWNEIKDIKVPNVTEGKTSDEVIEDIINHEKEYSGIDWRKVAEGTKEDKAAALKKAHDRIKELREKLSEEEVNTAKSMNLLDENGNVRQYDLFAMDEADAPLAPIPSDAAPYVVWGWTKKQTAEFQNATGGRIKDEICNLIRNFQVMQNDSTRYMVKTFMEAGLWGLGIYGLTKVYRIISALSELTEATEAYAVLSGVLEVGVNVIKLGITVVILAVLVPLFIFMTKNAAGIMVIINDTKDDLRLIDVHATHGKIVGIFKENAALDNPQPIIPKKLPPIVNPKTGKVLTEGSIQAGFFAARKKDAALYGSQGGLKFDATASYPKGVYVGWEVPLTNGKNCVLVSADYDGSASEFSNKTNSDGSQESIAKSSKHAEITARVNSGSGSEAYYVINVTEP